MEVYGDIPLKIHFSQDKKFSQKFTAKINKLTEGATCLSWL